MTGQNRINHSEPQHIEEIFPLAMTYMSEPKEASTAKIKKYLEKYYGKTDIENRSDITRVFKFFISLNARKVN